MKVLLKRPVSVDRMVVFAEMAWLSQRPELGLVCRAARDDGHGELDAGQVRGMLPGVSDVGARNVVDYCRFLGLVHDSGALTDLGFWVADSNEVPVPEQGVYELWVSDDPFLHLRVLHAARLQGNLDGRIESSGRSAELSVELGEVFQSVVDDRSFVVRNFPRNDKRPAPTGSLPSVTSLTLQWRIDFERESNEWKLVGNVPWQGKNRKVSFPPMSVELDLDELRDEWGRSLLRSVGRWNEQGKYLAVAFDQLSDDEVDSMSRSVQLTSVQTEEFGTFETVDFEDVPLGPKSKADAQRWAMDRLERSLTSREVFRTREQLVALFEQVVEQTPLEGFEPELPAHATLLSQWRNDTARFWHLAASEDLNPTPHEDQALLGSVIAGRRHGVFSTNDGSFVIPHNEKMSMEQLVGLLMNAGPASDLVLCDRYVRNHHGKNNLDLLQLFVDTARQLSPDVRVRVITEEKGNNLGEIEQITENHPLTYKEVFGKSYYPHDRYLLIRNNTGTSFAWQLSNSPLDGKPNGQGLSRSAPLLWRGLTATKLELERAPVQLRTVIEGTTP